MELTFKCTKVEETELGYKVYLECSMPDVLDDKFGLMMLRADKLSDEDYKINYAIGKRFTVNIEPE